MATSLLCAVLLAAALAAPGTAPTPVATFESQADLTPQGKIDELVFAQLEAVGHPAGQALLRRGVCPPGLSGRDRHAAHAPRRPGSSSRTGTRTSAAP